MHLDQLRYLIDLSETGSFTTTANRMYITQQAVSRSVQQMEKNLGVPILLRTKKGLIFTEEGKIVLQYAKEIIAKETEMVDALDQFCQRVDEEYPKQMLIASNSSVINLVLPQIIIKPLFRKQNCEVTIDIMTNFEQILTKIQEKEQDIGLVSINAEQFQNVFEAFSSELQADVLARDELVVITEKKHRKEGPAVVTRSEYHDRLWTGYNLFPEKDAIKNHNMVFSNDADFHRNIMEKTGAFVVMPGFAYQYFFNKKKYLLLSLENNQPILHVAIYRKDASKTIQQLASMIRLEMQIK